MLGLTRTKKAEEEKAQISSNLVQAKNKAEELTEDKSRLAEFLKIEAESNAELRRQLKEGEEEREKARRVLEAHEGKVRVGVIRFDPQELTSALRAIVSSIRVEVYEHKYVIYADRHLTQAEGNAIQAKIDSQVNMDTT